ncbi:ion channel [Neolewinella antarctica]|uniref:Inward rectifier potassium channel n=1 Tax=Neolewinella antarctica TaxID=442734 RepID=A0ABX0X8Y3_9BACT|nr:ion channel [Neolewinella antarctica]NJC25725.1 inward rectifier potassium channel [Neolewinella antarctica]
MDFESLKDKPAPAPEDRRAPLFNDFGLGGNVGRKPGTRLINNDGSFNVVHRGKTKRDSYKLLMDMSWLKLLATTIFTYVMINLVFSAGFLIIGTNSLSNIDQDWQLWRRALACFFFSIQTFTTVGYGDIAPVGIAANTLASLLALFGWVALAIVTGVFFARFAQPGKMIAFSKKALVAPYNAGGFSLQFRIVNVRDTSLINVTARVMLTWIEEGNRRFSPLVLERDTVPLFPLNWTIVHPIDEKSPIIKWDYETFCRQRAELLITVEGYDQTFSQPIHVQNSYIFDEIAWNARFKPMYLERDSTTEIWLDRLDDLEELGE